MAFHFGVKVIGDKLVSHRLDRMAERGIRPKAFQIFLGGKGYKQIIENFRKELDDNGKRWERLKTPRKRGGSKVLQDTGRLRSSIKWRPFGSGDVMLWSNLKYAAAHNFGYPPNNLPPRKFMHVPDEFAKKMAASFARYVAKGVTR